MVNVQRFPTLAASWSSRWRRSVILSWSNTTPPCNSCGFFRRRASHTLSCSGLALYEQLTEVPVGTAWSNLSLSWE